MDPFYEMCLASGLDLDELQEQINEACMAAFPEVSTRLPTTNSINRINVSPLTAA